MDIIDQDFSSDTISKCKIVLYLKKKSMLAIFWKDLFFILFEIDSDIVEL